MRRVIYVFLMTLVLNAQGLISSQNNSLLISKNNPDSCFLIATNFAFDSMDIGNCKNQLREFENSHSKFDVLKITFPSGGIHPTKALRVFMSENQKIYSTNCKRASKKLRPDKIEALSKRMSQIERGSYNLVCPNLLLSSASEVYLIKMNGNLVFKLLTSNNFEKGVFDSKGIENAIAVIKIIDEIDN